MASEYSSSLTYNLKYGHCFYCCNYIKPRVGIVLQQCHHLFCKQCLKFAIQIRKQMLKIPCPVASSRECNGYLLDYEVKELVSPDRFHEYIDRSLEIAKKKMRNVFYCKSEGCRGWCEFEYGRKTFICPVCNETNCMQCNCIHSFGDNCDNVSSSAVSNGWEQILEIMKISKGNWKPECCDLILNRLDFECPICFTNVDHGKGVILHECLHMFCFQCLNDLIEHNDESAMVRCPYIDGNYSCMSYLQPREIRSLVPDDIHEKHLQRSMKLGEVSGISGNNESSFHCKTPDCLGWCVYEENTGTITFECEICGRKNCIRCKVIHEGMTCEDYRNQIEQNENDKLSEETLERLIEMGEAMRCPKCSIPVQKIQGCDWLKCSVCQTEICWATRGARWGLKGKGDTTGGCGCTGRQRCHPSCRGCH